jgi:hypothetical protein
MDLTTFDIRIVNKVYPPVSNFSLNRTKPVDTTHEDCVPYCEQMFHVKFMRTKYIYIVYVVEVLKTIIPRWTLGANIVTIYMYFQSCLYSLVFGCTLQCRWLWHYGISRKGAGSIPDEIIEFFFQFTKSFQPHYGTEVDSACNRNEYQESSKSGRRVRPIILLPSVGRVSRTCGILDVSQPHCLPQPVTWIILLPFYNIFYLFFLALDSGIYVWLLFIVDASIKRIFYLLNKILWITGRRMNSRYQPFPPAFGTTT